MHICDNGGNRFCIDYCERLGHAKGGHCDFIHVCRCHGDGDSEKNFPTIQPQTTLPTTFNPNGHTTYKNPIEEIFARHTTTPDPKAPPTKSLYEIIFGNDENPTFTFFLPSFGFKDEE